MALSSTFILLLLSNKSRKLYKSLKIHSFSMATIDLGELVLGLAHAIEEYPKSSKQEEEEKAKAILELAGNLDQMVPSTEKQVHKNSLISWLRYETNGYGGSSTFHTISNAIIYLTDIGVKDIGKVVSRLPHVLDYDVETTMKPRVAYLKSIGVKDEDIGKVVSRHPQVLMCDVKKMQARVEYLKSIGIKDEDIGEVVTKHPQVQGYDVENNLKPTYEFLKDKFGATADILVKTPAYLGYSLNKRIKPRHAFLESKGLIEGDYANIHLLFPSDKIFCRKLNVPLHLQEYLEFKENYLQQHKAKA